MKILKRCLIWAGMLLVMCSWIGAVPESQDQALLLIDIQDFYFSGGRAELKNPEEAGLKAKQILDRFRELGHLVVHIRHVSKSESGIHDSVRPLKSEKIISKKYVNSFKETELLSFLKAKQIKKLIICGMMTHMCVEAAVRAASDYGFQVVLVHDACATRSLDYDGFTISAEDVHFSTLASLSGYYAEVTDTKAFLSGFKK